MEAILAPIPADVAPAAIVLLFAVQCCAPLSAIVAAGVPKENGIVRQTVIQLELCA